MQENMYGVSQHDWLQMTEGDRASFNQQIAATGAQPREKIDPTTLPDFRPDMVYDNYGTIAYASGPMGGAPSGGPGVGYQAVGPANAGGGAGAVGYVAAPGGGYTSGPPVASIGSIGDRGKGINADASLYRGGDFAGAGSGDFAFGPGANPTENITGTAVPDLSLSNYTGGDPNVTPYDQYGSSWENLGGDSYIDRMTGEQRSGGIGSDAGATRNRIAEIIAGGGGGGPLPSVGPLPGDIGGSPMAKPMPNIGYNPGMENSFANPAMRQFNPDTYQRQLEQILRGIDQGTANQNLDPNTGRSFYQGDQLQPSDIATPYMPGG